MDLSLLGDQHSTMQQIHPALDVVDDTLYVTIRTAIAGKATAIVLSSAGEAFGPAEWADHCAQHALLPISPGEPRRCAPRWHAAGMRATLEGLQAGGQKNVGEAPRWPDTYEAIHRALADHLQVRDERYLTLLALFGMMTYVHPLFDFLPILHLRGPAESGKSRAARALAGIAFNAAIAGYSTPATLFRQAHEGRYTQILTEADHLATATSADAFVRQLQSACSRGEARVDVAEGVGSANRYEPRTYYAFCPRVILSTKALGSQPLRTRCIRLDLVKIPNADQEKLRRSVEDDTVWAHLRDQLYQLQLLRWRDASQARNDVRSNWMGNWAPMGRAFEKWLPLATLATIVSPDAFTIVQQLAAEDSLDQQGDAADRDEARIIRFALWLVRDGHDHELSRADLYRYFTGDSSATSCKEDSPVWAQDMGVQVGHELLHELVGTETALIREMKRLDLVGVSRHTMTGNRYAIRHDHIVGIAEAVIGAQEAHLMHSRSASAM